MNHFDNSNRTEYDNAQYWQGLHRTLTGSLRAVGWPNLSETFNQLKYQSETESLLSIMSGIADSLAHSHAKSVSALEVGVGIGYWTTLLTQFFRQRQIELNLTCVDVSQDALEVTKSRNPQISTMQVDLKNVDTYAVSKQFMLVHAIAVLNHLKHLQDVVHGLLFCARSTADNGYLVIYDPILRLDFSPFNTIDWRLYGGNGMPHRLTQLDDVLYREGFVRLSTVPGVSFVLNSPLEARSRLEFRITNKIWLLLCRYVYTHDAASRRLADPLLRLDRFLKHKERANSATFVVYHRQ